MKHRTKAILALLVAVTIDGQVRAQIPATDAISIEHPWARATPGGAATGAAYITLINKGNTADELIGATTPVADQVQFHSVSEENGVSRMREMRAVEVKPGATVSFSPGIMHIMLVGLKKPLKEGQTFPLTLSFEKAGKVQVVVSVANVGAMQGEDMGPMMHGSDGMMK